MRRVDAVLRLKQADPEAWAVVEAAWLEPTITDGMVERGANSLIAHASDPALLRLFAPSVASRLAREVLVAALNLGDTE